MMTFPDTWEEFEKLYGFNDVEEIYTNNSRLIPSFRVKQWLDQLPSVQQEQLDCEDCIKNGGDWECDRVHCHKGDAISRQDAIDLVESFYKIDKSVLNIMVFKLKQLPSAQPERKKGKWIDYSDEGYVECPFCHSATNCSGNKDELHYCFSCGAELR